MSATMRVRVSRTFTGKQWHIKGIGGKSLCGCDLRNTEKELELTDKRICPRCKDSLYMLFEKKKRINEILRLALP